MSCNCSCTCEGTFQTPAISLPIHAIRFETGNSMHCAHSSPPRHRLACNFGNLTRDRRSIDMFSETTENSHLFSFTVSLTFVSFTVILLLCLICIWLTYNNYLLRKSLDIKNTSKEEGK